MFLPNFLKEPLTHAISLATALPWVLGIPHSAGAIRTLQQFDTGREAESARPPPVSVSQAPLQNGLNHDLLDHILAQESGSDLQHRLFDCGDIDQLAS